MQASTRRVTKPADPYNLRPYFGRILRQLHPGFRISRQAADSLNQIMGDLVEDIINAAIKIIIFQQQVTIYSHQIQLAIEILFPAQLAQVAMAKGNVAVQSFNATQSRKSRSSQTTTTSRTSVTPIIESSTIAHSTPVTSSITPPSSQTQQADGKRELRAGIIMSTSRIENIIRSITDPKNLRVGIDAVIYTSAVIDYISSEVLGLSGNVTIDNHRVTIYSSDILDAIYNDPELRHIFADWVFNQITSPKEPATAEVTYEEEPGEASVELSTTN